MRSNAERAEGQRGSGMDAAGGEADKSSAGQGRSAVAGTMPATAARRANGCTMRRAMMWEAGIASAKAREGPADARHGNTAAGNERAAKAEAPAGDDRARQAMRGEGGRARQAMRGEGSRERHSMRVAGGRARQAMRGEGGRARQAMRGEGGRGREAIRVRGRHVVLLRLYINGREL